MFQEIEKSNLIINKFNKNENEEEKSLRLSNIYFSQLVYAISNMKNFNIQIEEIKKMIFTFCSQNNLLERFENEIRLIIEN